MTLKNNDNHTYYIDNLLAKIIKKIIKLVLFELFIYFCVQ